MDDVDVADARRSAAPKTLQNLLEVAQMRCEGKTRTVTVSVVLLGMCTWAETQAQEGMSDEETVGSLSNLSASREPVGPPFLVADAVVAERDK